MPPEIDSFKTPQEQEPQPPVGLIEQRPASDKPAEKTNDSKPGLFDVGGLIGGFKRTMSDIGEAASAFLPPADKVLAPDKTPAEQKNEKAVSQATAAYAYADAHEAAYLRMQHRSPQPKLEPGQHTNENGSSFTVDVHGRISQFKTSGQDAATAVTFSDIKYDVNGEMLSYKSPTGHVFTRTTQNDSAGFGTWVVQDSQGHRVPYAGSNAWQWRAKVQADENGFHHMVGGGANQGALFTTSSDGTVVQSRVIQRDQYGQVLQTKVQLDGSTEVLRNSRLNGDKMTVNQQLRLNENNGESTRVLMDASGQSGKVLEAEKPKSPLVTADTNRIAERVIERIGQSQNPIGELSAALKNMEHLQAADLTRRIDGKHQVNLHFDRPGTAPPINAVIRGHRPNASQIDKDVSFVLSRSNSGGVKIEEMDGFSGSVTGPRGRVRASWTNAMHIGKDQQGRSFADIDSTVRGPFRMRDSSNRFYEHNFPDGSPIKHLMQNPDALREVGGALRLFQTTDDLTQITINQSSRGKFDVVSRSSEAKDIPVNQKLEQLGMTLQSIHLDKSLSATLSNDETGVSLSNMKGMTVSMDGGQLGKLEFVPKKVGLKTDSKGIPMVHIEVELNGQPIAFDVPVSKLQEMRNKKR